MRILHLLSQRPEFTGSGIYLQNIIGQAAAAGHQNFLVAGVPADGLPRLSCIDPDCCSYVTFTGGDLPFPVPGMSDVMPYASSRFGRLSEEQIAAYRDAFAGRIAGAIDAFAPDLIHSHHLWLMSGLVRELFPSLPLVTTCHSTDLRQFIQCPHLRPLLESSCAAIDRVMALGPDQSAIITELYRIPAGRIRVVGGGYDETLFFRADRQEGPPPASVRLLYAGKLSRSKGVPWLLRAVRQLDSLPLHLHLAGSGSGEEEAECHRLAAAMDGRITLHGRLPQAGLAALLRSSHLFVLPSFYEGLPLVLLEALASGCRVVATDLPGCREILAGGDPDLVELLALPPLGDVDSPRPEDEPLLDSLLARCLAGRVRRILESPPPDPEAAARLTGPYSWRSVFARVEAVYREALSEHGRR